MPSSWLNVPHFQQEHDYSCVAACVRMVLAHYSDIRTEAELRLLLDTQPTGTRAGNVLRLSGSAYEVQKRGEKRTQKGGEKRTQLNSESLTPNWAASSFSLPSSFSLQVNIVPLSVAIMVWRKAW
jgi:hypothetical protein